MTLFNRFVIPLLLVFLSPSLFVSGAAETTQKSKTQLPAPVNLVKRTTTRREQRHFNYGGTVTIVGAPEGSITIEAWPRAEVEVNADIELNAENEEDLTRLATVNNFIFDDDPIHVSILTTGVHDKNFMRRTDKNFPKKLLGLPWKIDYRIRVPMVTDLEINGGRGKVKVSGVDGAVRLSVVEGDTTLSLAGGVVNATIAKGNVVLTIPVRSWRGSGVDLRVALGTLTVELPQGFNGDVDADVLGTGKIEDNFGAFASREKPGITATIMRARAGAGGAFFKFTIGAGTLSIKKIETGQ